MAGWEEMQRPVLTRWLSVSLKDGFHDGTSGVKTASYQIRKEAFLFLEAKVRRAVSSRAERRSGHYCIATKCLNHTMMFSVIQLTGSTERSNVEHTKRLPLYRVVLLTDNMVKPRLHVVPPFHEHESWGSLKRRPSLYSEIIIPQMIIMLFSSCASCTDSPNGILYATRLGGESRSGCLVNCRETALPKQ